MDRQDSIGEQLTRGLWAAMRVRGRGTITAVEKRLGWRIGTLRDARNRKGGLRVSELGAVLEALDLPPSAFFADLFGGGVSAVDRFLADGGQLRKRVALPVLASPAAPDRLTPKELEALDAARFENARKAVQRARRVAQRAARDGRRLDAAAAVARQGSAHRVIGSLDHAHACLWWALTTAPPGTAVAVDSWLRAAPIASDRGDFKASADIAGYAALGYLELGDVHGIGRALVTRSTCLQYAGVNTAAIRGYLAALSYLPSTDSRNQFAVHQCLGLVYLDQGDTSAARHHVDQAAAIDQLPPLAAAHLAWLRAKIADEEGDYSTAIATYREVNDSQVLPAADIALTSAELCRVYLRVGRLGDATTLAHSMAWLTGPTMNRLVQAAVLDLVRSATKGEVRVHQVEATIAKLEGVRRAGKRTGPRADASRWAQTPAR